MQVLVCLKCLYEADNLQSEMFDYARVDTPPTHITHNAMQ